MEVLKRLFRNLAASHRTWNVTFCDENVWSHLFVTVPHSNPGPGFGEISARNDPELNWSISENLPGHSSCLGCVLLKFLLAFFCLRNVWFAEFLKMTCFCLSLFFVFRMQERNVYVKSIFIGPRSIAGVPLSQTTPAYLITAQHLSVFLLYLAR